MSGLRSKKSSQGKRKRSVLLIEPDYSNKYPPMGLMKLATYHRRQEKSDPAAINILCPDAAFCHRAFSPSNPTERRAHATNRISAVGQGDIPLARHGAAVCRQLCTTKDRAYYPGKWRSTHVLRRWNFVCHTWRGRERMGAWTYRRWECFVDMSEILAVGMRSLGR